MNGNILMLSLLIVGIVAATGVYAFGNPPQAENKDFGAFNAAHRGHWDIERNQQMQEHHEAVWAALENHDYAAWKSAMELKPRQPRVTEFVTEENFETFIQMHEAKFAGDLETAQQLAEELGIPGKGMGPRAGRGRMQNFVDADGDGVCDNLAGRAQQ